MMRVGPGVLGCWRLVGSSRFGAGLMFLQVPTNRQIMHTGQDGEIVAEIGRGRELTDKEEDVNTHVNVIVHWMAQSVI